MSAFVARSTMRAVQRRQFSLLTGMRQFARSFESHPFQRMSTASAKPDYGRLFRDRIVTAAFYFPTGLAILGWPYVYYLMFDGHI